MYNTINIIHEYFLSLFENIKIIKKSAIVKVEQEQLGFRSFKLLTLEDNTQWVLVDKPVERSIGYLHLKKALKAIELDNIWVAAETIIIVPDNVNTIKITINKIKNNIKVESDNLFVASNFAGSKKPNEIDLDNDKAKITQHTGFKDFDFNANLRINNDNKIMIFDTEFSSFNDFNNPANILNAEEKVKIEFKITDILGEIQIS